MGVTDFNVRIQAVDSLETSDAQMEQRKVFGCTMAET